MHWSAAVLLLLNLLAAPLLPAAEPGSTDTAETEATASTDTQDSSEEEEATPAAPATRTPGEDFVPSVQISEDLSVSFPTDI